MAKRYVNIPLATGNHLRWEVLWVVPNKEEGYRIVKYECENDLSEAIRVYAKALAGKKKMATLRCANSGFPPPEDLRPREVRRKKRVKGQPATKWIAPLRRLNNNGTYWCPYCRELRKFQHQNGLYIDGVVVPEPGLHCPICGVSHRDYHVRHWNPLARRMFLDTVKTKQKKWTLDGID